MLRRTLCLASVLALLSLPALAQDESEEPAPSRKVRYREVTEIIIGDDVDVNAPVLRPELSLLPERLRGRFDPMIELRRDFDDAMQSSVDEVR
jgi:hypothetical protein